MNIRRDKQGASILIGLYCMYKSPGQTFAKEVTRKKEVAKKINDDDKYLE